MAAAVDYGSLRSAIADVLNDLLEDDLDKFKFYIVEPGPEYVAIRRSKLETKKRPEILTAILDGYGVFTIDIVKNVLKMMYENKLLEELSRRCPYKPREVLAQVIEELKADLRAWFRFLSEGGDASGVNLEFIEGYTEPLITEGTSGQVPEEHEVSQMEREARRSDQERSIPCKDLFRGLTLRRTPIRTVLMKGVAGVGKTVLTQKFTLDWAEGKENQDIDLLFPFTFSALNETEEPSSLVELLHDFFDKTTGLFSFQQLKLLFILDGLDECRRPLDFRTTRVLTDPHESASVEELLVNLIRGDLCPDAKVWVTTRPAAANQVPERYISMVTEVHGFTDEQKEEFFRKRIPDQLQASVFIKHIKKIRSLYSLCYIPIFCWIVDNVRKHQGETSAELPSTLTQVYIKFLMIQVQVQNDKYEDREGSDSSEDPWTPEIQKRVWALAKLAFEQLMKGRLIFYKRDLIQCGLDADDIAHYSVFKVIFKFDQDNRRRIKVYCFIHLTVQEFLAALHVHETFFSTGENLLLSLKPSNDPEKNLLTPTHSFENPGSTTSLKMSELQTDQSEKSQQKGATKLETLKPSSLKSKLTKLKHFFKRTASPSPKRDEESGSGADPEDDPEPPEPPVELFYRSAVDLALRSPNGRLDLILHFLLGLSLPTNQKLLPGLLTRTGSVSTIQKTVEYITEQLEVKDQSAEKNLNLLHCLIELNDHSLLEEVQMFMRQGVRLSWFESPAEWSAVSFLLLSSDSDLEEFDFRKYGASEEALQCLLPVLKVSTKVI